MIFDKQFFARCRRLVRIIERSIHELPAEIYAVAWNARNAAMTVDQAGFRESKFVQDLAMANIAAFAEAYRRVTRRHQPLRDWKL